MDRGGIEQPLTLTPTSFAELGFQERQHLEAWIVKNPDILGTKLLLISSEYDRFDKSDKRLDLLALDDKGKLVIIELKRDIARSHADLQALRYAAFCSTMTFSDVVDLYMEFSDIHDREEAERGIRQFVQDQEFNKLDNKPRIILAAGGFEDTEITTCVLWLRTFGVDISCVEITPYRMPDGRIVLAPRVIIPLPEAASYIVGVEKKEVEQGKAKGVTKVPEEDLLRMAGSREIRPLLEVCREMKAIWLEGSLSVYGGSFLYWRSSEQGWRSLFGINVSGQRKRTPPGELDVWIPTKNLAEVTNQEESALRVQIKGRLVVIAEEKIDCVIRIKTTDDARVVVDLLKAWASRALQI